MRAVLRRALFAEIELAHRAEATRLEALGLEIESDDEAPLLVQPCAALKGRRCGIYPHRPGCCRTFECRLLQDVRCGAVSEELAHEHISQALASIAEMRSLLNRLGRGDARLPLRERCAEALMDAGAAAERTRLRRAMHALERQILAVFLEGRGPKD